MVKRDIIEKERQKGCIEKENSIEKKRYRRDVEGKTRQK